MQLRKRREGEDYKHEDIVECTSAEYLTFRKIVEQKDPQGGAKLRNWLVGKTILLDGSKTEYKVDLELSAERERELNNRGFHQNTPR